MLHGINFDVHRNFRIHSKFSLGLKHCYFRKKCDFLCHHILLNFNRSQISLISVSQALQTQSHEGWISVKVNERLKDLMAGSVTWSELFNEWCVSDTKGMLVAGATQEATDGGRRQQVKSDWFGKISFFFYFCSWFKQTLLSAFMNRARRVGVYSEKKNKHSRIFKIVKKYKGD